MKGGKDFTSFTEKYQNSWLYEELYNTRNFGPAMHKFGTFLVVHITRSIKTSLVVSYRLTLKMIVRS